MRANKLVFIKQVYHPADYIMGFPGSFQEVAMCRALLMKIITIISIGCIFLLSAFLFGCCGISNKSADLKASTAVKTESKDTTENKITIRLLTRYANWDSLAPVINDLQNKFEKNHPDVVIQNDSLQEEAAYDSKLRSDISAGNVANIFMLYGSANLVPYAKNGMLMDITPMLEDKEWASGFQDNAFDNWNFKKYGLNGIYGIPTQFSPEVFYYNTELFRKAGIAKTPDTMEELYQDIKMLRDHGIIPWGAGAKESWRFGHIHNNIIYKLCGVQKLVDIGAREAKWTDPEVVESFYVLKKLKDIGAFDTDFENLDSQTESSNFLNEKYAMTLNGSWFLSDVLDSKIKDKIGIFSFPYFGNKPQFKDNGVVFANSILLNGKLTGREKELTIEFAKLMTSRETTNEIIKKAQRTGARKDVNIDELRVDGRFKFMIDYMKNIKVPGGDYFDYDPLNSMKDRIRNSIISLMFGNSPETAAKEIQDEIDKSIKTGR